MLARTRWGFLFLVGVVGLDALAVACDSIDREPSARYYIAPDAETDGATPAADSGLEDTGDGDGSTADAPLDAPLDGDGATPPTGAPPATFATGSAFHPDALIGNGDHTCIVATAAASVFCWGANDHGQLGLGTTGNGTLAADVATATRITIDETGLAFDGIEELALAGWHSCARRGADLFCWGQRFSAAQAEPASAVGPDRTQPRAIGNLAVKRIAADGPHTCAIKANNHHVCFGHSTFNELGRANTDDAVCTSPLFYAYQANATHKCAGTLLEATKDLPGILTIAAGEVHSCAQALDRVHCWGTNLGGQLGRPGGQVGEPSPQEVVVDSSTLAPLDGVIALASGGKHSCAIKKGAAAGSGSVYCWGTNDAGQLGVAAALTPTRAFAAPVAGIDNVTAIAIAERISCAVKSDKTVWCWGTDMTALPDGGAIVSTPTPTQIKGPAGVGVLDNVVSVAPGLRHVCAKKADNTVWCWGKNDRGQLGSGTKVDSSFPVKVTGLP